MQLLLIECKSPLHLLGPLLSILFGKTSKSCQQLFSTTLNFPGLIFIKHFHCHCYMSHSVKFMSQNNLSLEVFESLFFFFRHFLNFLCLLCPIFVVQRYSWNQSTITVIVLRQDMLKMKKQLKQMTTRSESVYSTRSHYGRLWKDYKKRILVLQCESVQSLSVKISAVEENERVVSIVAGMNILREWRETHTHFEVTAIMCRLVLWTPEIISFILN